MKCLFRFVSGDWAGSVWTDSGIPGQEQSCAQSTGYPTCEAFVMAEGSAFTEACTSQRSFSFQDRALIARAVDWEVKSVKIYQYQS